MEPIAVIGIGCRFPQASNPEAFWQLLRDGSEAITPIPQDRWQVSDFYDPDPQTPGKMNVGCGGFLDRVDEFDAEFFGMSAAEVEHTDPQQRLFLEVAWEALENAGIAPTSLEKTQTGVFTGLCTIDYHRLLYQNYDRLSSYSGTGTTMSITANRLSYFLGLQGPSMAVDAACSSSLVTVHLACQSLRSGESNLCVAGGINLILAPDSTISSAKTRLLSVQERCRSFDAEADGYTRGEGCGVVILKRLSDAVEHNDNILAVIRGSAVNHNGQSNSLSAPNGLSQQAVIRQALKNAGVSPAEVSYVDAHAVGTAIGDAIEFKALQAVYSEKRQPDLPCGVGSVKTNIGHLEAAAGISALIKVILALQHKEIPAHLHLQRLNPYISLQEGFYIPTQLQLWSNRQRSRMAGVSAFGFGGTNAHVILEEAPSLKQQQQVRSSPPLHLVTLSARNALALEQLAQKYLDLLELQPQIDLGSLAHTTNTGRNHFQHRLCAIAESTGRLGLQLQAFLEGQPTAGLMTGRIRGRKRPQAAWFFPGHTSNIDTVDLFTQTQPVFRQAIERCEKIARSYLSQPLFLDSAARSHFSPAEKLQCDRFVSLAIEYSLAQLWLDWGIKPQAVMGWGVGELVAAAISESLKLEEAFELVATQPLQTDKAVGSSLLRAIDQIHPKIPLVFDRNLTEEKKGAVEYWSNHGQQPEKDYNPPEALSDYQLVLTMGARATIPIKNDVRYLFSYGDEPQASCQEILHSLGNLYIRGIEIDWSRWANSNCEASGRHRRPIPLPTYPFQRQRYWFTSKPETTVEPTPQLR